MCMCVLVCGGREEEGSGEALTDHVRIFLSVSSWMKKLRIAVARCKESGHVATYAVLQPRNSSLGLNAP